MQDKNTRISGHLEGGAKQHPNSSRGDKRALFKRALCLGKTKSTVKVGSWSTVKPPSRRSDNRTLFCQNPREVAFEESVKRCSWRDTLTVSLVSPIVLCQNFFGLNHLTPPFRDFFPPPLLSLASTLSELKWAITSPKKGQAMQRCHEEQSARSKCARLSPLEFSVLLKLGCQKYSP